MRNIIAKGILFGCTVGLLCACGAKKVDPAMAVDKDQIKKEIQAREDSFASVYNSGEVRSIGYYADDAISFFQNRAPLVGKQAIVAFLKNDLAANTNKISFKTKEVFVAADGNQVLEVGGFSVVDSANAPVNTGNYMTLFEKRKGK